MILNLNVNLNKNKNCLGSFNPRRRLSASHSTRTYAQLTFRWADSIDEYVYNYLKTQQYFINLNAWHLINDTCQLMHDTSRWKIMTKSKGSLYTILGQLKNVLCFSYGMDTHIHNSLLYEFVCALKNMMTRWIYGRPLPSNNMDRNNFVLTTKRNIMTIRFIIPIGFRIQCHVTMWTDTWKWCATEIWWAQAAQGWRTRPPLSATLKRLKTK